MHPGACVCAFMGVSDCICADICLFVRVRVRACVFVGEGGRGAGRIPGGEFLQALRGIYSSSPPSLSTTTPFP